MMAQALEASTKRTSQPFLRSLWLLHLLDENCESTIHWLSVPVFLPFAAAAAFTEFAALLLALPPFSLLPGEDRLP